MGRDNEGVLFQSDTKSIFAKWRELVNLDLPTILENLFLWMQVHLFKFLQYTEPAVDDSSYLIWIT